jgi:hypothetical protein
MTSCRLALVSVLLLGTAWLAGAPAQSAEATAPARPQSGPRTIFEQPVLAGIAGNFHVPPTDKKYRHDKPFYMILWQANPARSDGELVQTDWRAGDKTGFYPPAAFRNAAGSSTMQIAGDTIGAYLNSRTGRLLAQ